MNLINKIDLIIESLTDSSGGFAVTEGDIKDAVNELKSLKTYISTFNSEKCFKCEQQLFEFAKYIQIHKNKGLDYNCVQREVNEFLNKKMKQMNEYEENYTLLRNLNNGDEYIDKSNCIGRYIDYLGNDRHLIMSVESNQTFEVPHGRFPVFKKINTILMKNL